MQNLIIILEDYFYNIWENIKNMIIYFQIHWGFLNIGIIGFHEKATKSCQELFSMDNILRFCFNPISRRGGGIKASPQKITHIFGNFSGRCLNSSDFSWFSLTNNIKKELENLSSGLFFMAV